MSPKVPGFFTNVGLFGQRIEPEIDSPEAFQAELNRRLAEVKQRWEGTQVDAHTEQAIAEEIREILYWADQYLDEERKYKIEVGSRMEEGGAVIDIKVSTVMPGAEDEEDDG